MTLHAIVRRSMDLVALADKDQPGDEKPINPLALLVIALTFLGFLMLMFTISYTYGHLIPTLCMIETPSPQAYVPVGAAINADAPPAYDATPKPDDEEADILLVANKPITSSIRGTIQHLRARAGYWSRFRGLSVFLVWTFVRSFITNLIAGPFMHPLVFVGAAIIAETLLARLHLTWVQYVPNHRINSPANEITALSFLNPLQSPGTVVSQVGTPGARSHLLLHFLLSALNSLSPYQWLRSQALVPGNTCAILPTNLALTISTLLVDRRS